jgi:hypothetical protein
MKKEKLDEVLELHNLWLQSDGKEGKNANLVGANLEYTYRPEGIKGYETDNEGFIIIMSTI